MKENIADSLASYFADKVAGKNQHVIIRIVGSAGMGKSYLGLQLCRELANEMSKRLGGVPEDYFTFANMGVISVDEIKRVMTNPKLYNILFLDDVGVAWNARKYQGKDNISMNDVIQTFRPQRNVVVMTLQAGFLMDRVPRSLAHYEIEMESANFEAGFTVCKVNKIVMKHKIGKIHYPYIFEDGVKHVRYISQAPPKEFCDLYEAERAKQLLKQNEEKEVKIKEKIPNKSDVFKTTWIALQKEGYSLREIGRMTNSDPSYIGDTLNKHKMKDNTDQENIGDTDEPNVKELFPED